MCSSSVRGTARRFLKGQRLCRAGSLPNLSSSDIPSYLPTCPASACVLARGNSWARKAAARSTFYKSLGAWKAGFPEMPPLEGPSCPDFKQYLGWAGRENVRSLREALCPGGQWMTIAGRAGGGSNLTYTSGREGGSNGGESIVQRLV